MNIMKALDAIAFTTVVSGALYLGFLGITGLDIIAAIFGKMSLLSRVIYCIIGLAAMYQLSQFRVVHQRWAHSNPSAASGNE